MRQRQWPSRGGPSEGSRGGGVKGWWWWWCQGRAQVHTAGGAGRSVAHRSSRSPSGQTSCRRRRRSVPSPEGARALQSGWEVREVLDAAPTTCRQRARRSQRAAASGLPRRPSICREATRAARRDQAARAGRKRAGRCRIGRPGQRLTGVGRGRCMALGLGSGLGRRPAARGGRGRARGTCGKGHPDTRRGPRGAGDRSISSSAWCWRRQPYRTSGCEASCRFFVWSSVWW
jgi:hypothetical protein